MNYYTAIPVQEAGRIMVILFVCSDCLSADVLICPTFLLIRLRNVALLVYAARARKFSGHRVEAL